MDTLLIIQALVIPFITSIALTLIIGFFAFHAAQRISDPVERCAWLILIIPFNIIGTSIYIFTKWKQFHKIGKGGLITASKSAKQPLSTFFKLSEAEMSAEQGAAANP